MIDYKRITAATNLTQEEAKTKYDKWLAGKKGQNGRPVPDLKLISLLSGFSTASISHFINKKGRISEESAHKINEVVKGVNYTPSSAAKRLRSIQKKSIGFVAPISNSPSPSFYIEILKGVKEEAQKFGYTVDIHDIEENREKNFFKKASFLGMVDGLITVSMDLEKCDLTVPRENFIPIVNIHSRSNPEQIPIISSIIPETKVFCNLLEYLFGEKGFRKPLLLSLSPENHRIRKLKINYYKKVMKKYDLSFNKLQHIQFMKRHTFKEAQNVYKRVRASSYVPDVYICLSDIAATAICRELSKDKKRVAVTGHDNADISTLFDLTTIDQQMLATGRAAFERLYMGICYILNNKHFPEYHQMEIKHELIIRGSTSLP